MQKETHLQAVDTDFTEHNAKVIRKSALKGLEIGVPSGVALGLAMSMPCVIAGPGGYAFCAGILVPIGLIGGSGGGAGSGALIAGTVSYSNKIKKQGLGLYKYSVFLKGQKSI